MLLVCLLILLVVVAFLLLVRILGWGWGWGEVGLNIRRLLLLILGEDHLAHTSFIRAIPKPFATLVTQFMPMLSKKILP